MRNVVLSAACAFAALLAGTLCHRISPGLGLVLMPMFWPLAFLACKVPLRFSLPTAAAVPLLSCLLTGMPSYPLVVSLKFAVLALMVGYFASSVAPKLSGFVRRRRSR